MHVVLRTERLLLRRFADSPADEDALVDLDSDPAVMRFLTGGVPTSRDAVRARVLPAILADYAAGDAAGQPDRFGCWAATELATDAFVGWFALTRPDRADPRDADEAELGYRLRAAVWGRGYATEGSRALIERAFSEHGLRRVHAETMAVNTPSRRVMERLGMRHVRTFHLEWDDPIDGVEHGEVEYEICRTDWLGSRS